MKIALWIVGIVAIVFGLYAMFADSSANVTGKRELLAMSETEFREVMAAVSTVAVLTGIALVAATIVFACAAMRYRTCTVRLVVAALVTALGAIIVFVTAGFAMTMTQEMAREYGSDPIGGSLFGIAASCFVAWAAISTAVAQQSAHKSMQSTSRLAS